MSEVRHSIFGSALFCILTVLVSGSSGSDEFVAIVRHNTGSQAFYAVTSDGDFFEQDGDLIWHKTANIFYESGYSGEGVIVALSNQTPTPLYPCAITQTGDYFIRKYPTSTWIYEGNIFAISGHTSAGAVVGLEVTGPNSFSNDYKQDALTASGDWYRLEKYHPWRFMGNIADLSGVVESESMSLNALKELFN
jgi:hypothetical protein